MKAYVFALLLASACLLTFAPAQPARADQTSATTYQALTPAIDNLRFAVLTSASTTAEAINALEINGGTSTTEVNTNVEELTNAVELMTFTITWVGIVLCSLLAATLGYKLWKG